MHKRMKCFANRKNLAFKNFHEIGIDPEKVYINENLTPTTRSLFHQPNILKKKPMDGGIYGPEMVISK